MNSVHLVTQEKYRVKQGQNRLSAPSAQPIGPAARPGHAQTAQPTVPRAPATPRLLACLPRARATRLQRVPACRAPAQRQPALRAQSPAPAHPVPARPTPARPCRLCRACVPRALLARRVTLPRAQPSAQPLTQMGSSPF